MYVRRVVMHDCRGCRAVVLTCTALLGTSGLYLLALRMIESAQGTVYTNPFSLWLFAAHLLIGFLVLVPLVPFSFQVLRAESRPTGVGARVLFLLASALVVFSGVALCQFDGLPRLLTGTIQRDSLYVLHLVAPVVAAVAYVIYRRRGSAIRWRWGVAWSLATLVFIGGTLGWHLQRPQRWLVTGTGNAHEFYEPSQTRTVDGERIPADALMTDEYCRRCHEDTYQDWFHSVHHFSSFNNPVYRFSVRETREVGLMRDGNVRASRWCAGCHDPVPFLSGEFDDPHYDDVNNPTAHAGITCTACHAITNVNSTVGNGAYTIEAPQHYPLALSENPVLQWVSDQMLKARPDFHKKSLLKPFHRSPEFCSTCHKVSLPLALNHYKEFFRGQDHYGSFLLSGASGHGARGFYYPPIAKTQCNDCHMPLRPSNDFAARDFDGSGLAKIHGHSAPGANTGVAWLVSETRDDPAHVDSLRRAVQMHSDFLRGMGDWAGKPALRIDIFGLKQGGTIDSPLTAPLRPESPPLVPGEKYLVEVVLRTLNVGHLFTDGTADSNEVWVEFVARSGDRIIGQSGGMAGPDDSGEVDRWAHFVKALVLDRNGNRINRHNPQDIFAAVYDHQIPPGAAQVVHYALEVPRDVTGPIELSVRLRYRKFDHEYASYVAIQDHPDFLPLLRESNSIPDLLNRQPQAVARMLDTQLDRVSKLPIVDMCEDRIILPVAGVADDVPQQVSDITPAWERWNDYGIGCYLEGGVGAKRGELRQAEAAFRHLLTLDDPIADANGLTNLARVYLDQGRLADAADVLNQARALDPPAPWWTVAWLTAMVNSQTGHLDEAIASFQQILEPSNQLRQRKFDFTKDFVIINELANALFKRAQQQTDEATRTEFLHRAVRQYTETLRIDSEDLRAHYGLSQCFARLGGTADLSDTAPRLTAVDAARLKLLAGEFADAGMSHDARLQAATQLYHGIEQFSGQPADPNHPKLKVWQELVIACRPVYSLSDDSLEEAEPSEDSLRRAAAALLGVLYRRIHELLKPDEIARDRTVRLYRQQHPAADHAAEAIVIYDLHRPAAVAGQDSKVGVSAKEEAP